MQTSFGWDSRGNACFQLFLQHLRRCPASPVAPVQQTSSSGQVKCGKRHGEARGLWSAYNPAQKIQRKQRSQGSPPEQDSHCLGGGNFVSSFVSYLNFLQEVIFLISFLMGIFAKLGAKSSSGCRTGWLLVRREVEQWISVGREEAPHFTRCS